MMYLQQYQLSCATDSLSSKMSNWQTTNAPSEDNLSRYLLTELPIAVIHSNLANLPSLFCSSEWCWGTKLKSFCLETFYDIAGDNHTNKIKYDSYYQCVVSKDFLSMRLLDILLTLIYFFHTITCFNGSVLLKKVAQIEFWDRILPAGMNSQSVETF